LASILIIEDEQLLGKSLEASLCDDGHDAHWVMSAEEGLDWLNDRQVDLAVVDCRLPGISGLEFLERLSQASPDTVAIMMTANADVRTAVSAMKKGAVDFLIKPVDLEALSLVADKNLAHRKLSQTWKHEQKKRTQEFGLHKVLGDCPGIERAKSLVRRIGALPVSPTATPPNVLITGETGTGKDLFARAIHFEGPRRSGPFVHINCAALPAGLVESELFGHAKGSFTDARASKRGLFEVADQGTLFLDEIASLPLPLQAKVLTAIGNERIRPVGGADEIAVNVHLIAAMNEDPLQLMKEGRFREDLYHRLRVMHIDIPPLRQRGGDVELLAEHFVGTFCRKFGMTEKKLSPATRRTICTYPWPGNVRELSHALESAVLLSGDEIEPEYLPAQRPRTTRFETLADSESIPIDFSCGPIPLEGVERKLIVRAMETTDNNVTRAAHLLDVSRDTLRYRLDKFGIDHRQNGTPQS
jgi:two-component system, NtrC family, response regulator AtoC